MAVNQLTFKKKERAKKKQQKKQEKLEKRLLKKDSNDKGKSLEDMLAYVDEYGNITTTPPEKRAPSENREHSGSHEEYDEYSYGKVSYYNVNGHYGFIRDNQTRQTIYFNDRLVGQPLDLDQKVKYKSVRTRQGEQISEVELL